MTQELYELMIKIAPINKNMHPLFHNCMIGGAKKRDRALLVNRGTHGSKLWRKVNPKIYTKR